MQCNTSRKLLPQALYGDLAPRQQGRLEDHLAGCTDCSSRYAALRQTRAVVSHRELPTADDEALKGFWDRLEPWLVPPVAKPGWKKWLENFPVAGWPARPAFAAAAAMLLVATGIFIGRINLDSLGGDGHTVSAAVIDASLVADFDAEFSAYLERTKLVLLGLENLPSDEVESLDDLSIHRHISQELLLQGRSLRGNVVMRSNQSLNLLIDDIERILLQLANSEDDDVDLTIQIIRAGMEQNALLFNITITELSRDEAPSP